MVVSFFVPWGRFAFSAVAASAAVWASLYWKHVDILCLLRPQKSHLTAGLSSPFAFDLTLSFVPLLSLPLLVAARARNDTTGKKRVKNAEKPAVFSAKKRRRVRRKKLPRFSAGFHGFLLFSL
jgi:hypothetical protein